MGFFVGVAFSLRDYREGASDKSCFGFFGKGLKKYYNDHTQRNIKKYSVL